jgi:hypothetical protein
MVPRTAAVLAALMLFAGCTTGFVYNRLDRVAYWYFSRQVTLSEVQAQHLRTDLRQLLQWHRRSELPRYAALLDSLSRDARHPIGRARIDASRREIEALWRDVVQRASPHAALWLAELSDAQLEELFGNLAQDDDELRAKYCEPDERTLARRRERAVFSGIAEWTGRLSREQRELVKATVAKLEPTGCEWVANQRVFRRDLRTLLESRTREPTFAESLGRFLLSPEERWTERYRQSFVANREHVVSLLAQIDATLSPRQRTRLAGKFADLARDLRNLAQARSTARGELGDGHDVRGRLRGPGVPDVRGESLSAHPL